MSSYDPAWLDTMYNNRALVPDFADWIARWATDSALVRGTRECTLDEAYGDGPNETLDIFPGASVGAPVLFFIHGGWWRSLDKSDHSFVAPAFNDARGACVVVPNYALCPGTPEAPVTIPDIAMQMVRALSWTWRHIRDYGGDRSRITVMGHSAGGHLAAMMLACHWRSVAPDLPEALVRNALSISGVFDLKPLQHTAFLADSLRLTDADSLRASPALWPSPPRVELCSVVGADESAEFLRQNALIQQVWGHDTVPVSETLPGRHHFSALQALVEADHPAQRHALRLLDR
jgi:arylformamidase